jgi:hypothetical protein
MYFWHAYIPPLLKPVEVNQKCNVRISTGITEMKINAQKNREELLESIATPSDRTTSGGGSSVSTEVESQGPDNSL